MLWCQTLPLLLTLNRYHTTPLQGMCSKAVRKLGLPELIIRHAKDQEAVLVRTLNVSSKERDAGQSVH